VVEKPEEKEGRADGHGTATRTRSTPSARLRWTHVRRANRTKAGFNVKPAFVLSVS